MLKFAFIVFFVFQWSGHNWCCHSSGSVYVEQLHELMQRTIVQLSSNPQMSERRSNTICAVVELERPDHHWGTNLFMSEKYWNNNSLAARPDQQSVLKSWPTQTTSNSGSSVPYQEKSVWFSVVPRWVLWRWLRSSWRCLWCLALEELAHSGLWRSSRQRRPTKPARPDVDNDINNNNNITIISYFQRTH